MDKNQLQAVIDLKDAIEALIVATSAADKRFSEVKTKEDLSPDNVKELLNVYTPVAQADVNVDKSIRKALATLGATADPLTTLILGALAMRFSASGTTTQMLCGWVMMLHQKAVGAASVELPFSFNPGSGPGPGESN